MRCVVLSLVLWQSLAPCHAQGTSVAARNVAPTQEVVVDVGEILRTNRPQPLGLNVDYLIDDDRNVLLSPKRPLREALKELRTTFLRYPGGWKSAINLWSAPPYTSSRPTLAGRVPESWIRPGLKLTTPEGDWRLDPLDFDEFVRICQGIGAEPTIVVPYESCYWQPTGEWKPPSRELLLETAAAWVRYANRTKNYGVKYWEVGNESWLKNENWTNGISKETYASDLVEFARRMKAEDPAILVGANGDSDEWWKTVLSRAAEQIDFLSVHTYPCWKWPAYETYRTNSLDGLGPIRVAVNAIARHTPAQQQRLRIMVTEFAAGTFGEWDKVPADLGRALIAFDLQGQLLQCPDVYFSQFWNTHNVYSEIDGGVFEVFKRDNSLSPIGLALRIWGQFLGDEMVAAQGTASVRCFASYQQGRQLVVFLVNKEPSAQTAMVSLKRLPTPLNRGAKWALHGNGPADQNPSWERLGEIRVEKSAVTMSLEPVSITVIALGAEAKH
jgi:hypothetical protein